MEVKINKKKVAVFQIKNLQLSGWIKVDATKKMKK
jgi:hypothetical protein